MMKRILLIIVSIGLAACGSSGDGSGAVAETCGKDITSSWETRSFEAIQSSLDLSSHFIGTTRGTSIVFAGGETCTVDVKLTGSDCSGEALVTNALYAGGGSGDPGCDDLEETYSYSVGVLFLSLCVDGDCTEFE